MKACVRQSDCRTGWLVVDERGRTLETYRRKESADAAAAAINAPSARGERIAWLEETRDGFTITDRE
jgi:hypothetical protein